MKSEIKQEDPDFQPVTLTITLESPDEVRSFYHRMNLATSTVRESKPIFVKHGDSDVDQSTKARLFHLVEPIARRLEE